MTVRGWFLSQDQIDIRKMSIPNGSRRACSAIAARRHARFPDDQT
jgi:hypothetical protein